MPIMYLSMGSGARSMADGGAVSVAREGIGKLGEDVAAVEDGWLEGSGLVGVAAGVVGVGASSLVAGSPGA